MANAIVEYGEEYWVALELWSEARDGLERAGRLVCAAQVARDSGWGDQADLDAAKRVQENYETAFDVAAAVLARSEEGRELPRG